MDRTELDHIDSQLTDRDRADLAALARDASDPSLAALRERIAADPGLSALLAEQHRVRETVTTAAAAVSAPSSLRIALDEQQRRLAPQRRRRRLLLGGSVAGVLAAGVLAIVLASPSGTPGGPSLAAAAAATQRPAAAPAPPTDPANPKLLTLRVDGVPFPDWVEKFKWQATGTRHDRVGGRDIETVLYRSAKGATIAYGIVAGKAIDVPDSAGRRVYDGVTFRTVTDDGLRILTWQREGHTCVLTTRAAKVPQAKLLELAAWKGKGGVPF